MATVAASDSGVNGLESETTIAVLRTVMDSKNVQTMKLSLGSFLSRLALGDEDVDTNDPIGPRTMEDLKLRTIGCWSPTIYKPRELWEPTKTGGFRANHNVDKLTMLVLDIDNKDSKGRPFDNPITLTELDEAFEGYLWFFYTSVSYDPQGDLRGRFVLPLAEPIPACQSVPLHRWAQRKLKGRLDRQTFDAARLWFLPHKPDGFKRAFFTARRDGKLFRPEDRYYKDKVAEAGLVPQRAQRQAARDPLELTDPKARLAVAQSIGATISQREAGHVAHDIECPKCGRDSVYFYLRPAKTWSAHCNHANSCGWRGSLGSLVEEDLYLDDFEPRVRLQLSEMVRLALTAPVPHEATDKGAAERLAHYFPEDAIFVEEEGLWRVFNGAWWASDPQGARVKQMLWKAAAVATDSSHALGSEVQLAVDAAVERKVTLGLPAKKSVAVITEETEVNTKKAIRRVHNAGPAEAACRIATSMPTFLRAADTFNSNPFLLAFNNGTYDLESGELRDADPHDYIAGGIPIDYDEDARCPLFEQTVEKMIPDPETRAYFQMVLGASLYAGNLQQEFYILVGEGSNGKSTVMEAVRQSLGEYGTKLPAKSIKAGESTNQDFDLVGLHGARFAVITEWDKSGRMDVERMKRITGEATLRAAHKGKDAFNFRATHNLFMVTQHAPTTFEQDRGTWRRLVIIPCDGTIEPGEVDRTIGARMLAEQPGIIAWMVEGMRMYMTAGMRPERPKAVVDATNDYRDGSLHPIERWFIERVAVGHGRVFYSEAYEHYLSYRRATAPASRPIERDTFLKEMRDIFKRRGLHFETGSSSYQGMKDRFWDGIYVSQELSRERVIDFNEKKRERTGKPPRDKG